MRGRIRTMLIWLLLIGLTITAGWYGIKLRRDVFVGTMDQRFTRNIINAWLWGRNAEATGVFNVYDYVARGENLPAFFPLDYPPLRLSIATLWQIWTRRHYTGEAMRQWHPEYDFNAPMLWTDTVAAMLGALMAFLLVRMWVIRMDDAQRSLFIPSPGTLGEGQGEGSVAISKPLGDAEAEPSPQPSPGVPGEGERERLQKRFRGVWQGLLAALLIWFNPAALWNGYSWVQWDMWPVPFYLAAVLLACVDWWFAAGVCLAIGSCLKGQMLIAVPIMFVWPIFKLRFDALLQLIAGLGLMFMAIVFPWLNPSKTALTWFIQMLVAAGLLAPIAMRFKFRRIGSIALAVIAVLLAWPWTSEASVALRLLPLAVLAIVALARYLPVRNVPHVYALAVAMAIPLMIPLFNGHTGWFKRGFQAGEERSQKMHDVGTYNLPALLQNLNSTWPNDNMFTVIETKGFGRISMKTASIVLYVVSLLLCGFFAARFEKQRDTRFLLAMFLPWMFLYMLLPQMFSRYLLWAGVISGILSGVGIGLTLLGVLTSLIATAGMIQNHYQMIGYDRDIFRQLEAVEPHLGWMLVVITLVYLYFMFVPRPRSMLPPSPSGRGLG